MKRVDGRPLDEVIAGAPALADRLALLPALIAACDALAHAHGQGVVHRGLVPASVRLGAHGETMVIGWGQAAAVADEDADPRDDVAALGALAYQLFAGAPAADPPRPLAAVVPDLPADLAAITAVAMSADRYPTARELAADLTRFQAGQLVSAQTYSTGALVRRWLRRHRAAVAVAAVLALATAGLGAVSLRRIVAERERADQQRALADGR